MISNKFLLTNEAVFCFDASRRKVKYLISNMYFCFQLYDKMKGNCKKKDLDISRWSDHWWWRNYSHLVEKWSLKNFSIVYLFPPAFYLCKYSRNGWFYFLRSILDFLKKTSPPTIEWRWEERSNFRSNKNDSVAFFLSLSASFLRVSRVTRLLTFDPSSMSVEKIFDKTKFQIRSVRSHSIDLYRWLFFCLWPFSLIFYPRYEIFLNNQPANVILVMWMRFEFID